MILKFRKIMLISILIFNSIYILYLSFASLSSLFDVLKFVNYISNESFLSHQYFMIFYFYTLIIEIVFITIIDRKKEINKEIKKNLLHANLFVIITFIFLALSELHNP